MNLPAIEQLNPEQKKAVLQADGRVLILAGAGSGKTMVLTMRMAYLVESIGVMPENILGLTFTNKAANEMRCRLASLIDPKAAKRTTLSTFHSFCMSVLREDIHHLGYTSQFTLLDEKDVQRIVVQIIRDYLGREGEIPSAVPTIAALSRLKNLHIPVEKFPTETWHDRFLIDLFKRLKDSMRAYNAVDFDSLLSLTVELFEEFPDVAEKYRNQYRYIMIDEYQDTNPVQYRLAELLSQKNNNLCVVGDDDQSIYGWRGADIKNILKFDRAVVIKLEQNYRSTNTILRAANAVISNNPERYAKTLWSSKGDGSPIHLFHAKDDIEEAMGVAYRLAAYKEKYRCRWRDFAVLYRSNALSRQLESALLKQGWMDGNEPVRGIPYEIFGGVEFYERREIKDLVSYLRVIANPKDQEALLRIVNYPRRGIGEGTLDLLTQYNRENNLPLWSLLKGVAENKPDYAFLTDQINQKARTGLSQLVSTIEWGREEFQEGKMSESLCGLIEKINYKKAIHEEVKSDQMRIFKWENVQEFVSAVAEYEHSTIQNKSLVGFITSLSLNENKDFAKNDKNQQDRVNLLTIHSAKGLEFKFCFLVGVEDHIIPHEKSMKETGIQEERRLMYVAITRAKEFLTVSMSRKRNRMGVETPSEPSRFLKEIPKEFFKFTKVDEV